MTMRAVHWLSLVLVLVAATAGLLLAGWLIAVADLPTPFALAVALAVTGLATIAAWLLQEFAWLRPLHALEREIRLQMHANPERAPALPAWHGLGAFPATVHALSERARDVRELQERAVAESRALAEGQRARLEGVLQALADGVIGCSADRRILLFNDAARRILRAPPELGLDRPLDHLFAAAPVRQVFGVMRRKAQAGLPAPGSEPFACASADGSRLFRCRMILFGTAPDQGFILDFVDLAPRGGFGERSSTLDVIRRIRALRGPAGSVLAAAELLARPDLEGPERARFGDTVERDGEVLRERLALLEDSTARLVDATWPEADFLSSDLALQVGHLLGETEQAPALVPVGPTVWMRGDVVHLGLLVEHLVHELAKLRGVRSFDLHAVAADRRVRLDLSFPGPPVAAALLGQWLDEGVREAAGVERLSDVLERHGGEIWSERAGDGRALVRLLLPRAIREEAVASPEDDLPPRPEFYDFDLMARLDAGPELLDRPLASLTFVVFDTETTGLDPRRDRIIQIAAVRIVNRRLLTGDTFDRLIDPGRRIPRSSIRFHGITDEMVSGRPPIEVVLPQFHAFADGAVLVAHNAAFDLAFMREAEAAAGAVFDHPVLDTLLLSSALHGHTDQHGLDAIAERFGVTPTDRHRALGDALTTAEVFLRMIDLLQAQGVRTLREALALGERAVEVRKRQAEAFGPGRARTVHAGG